MLSDSPPERCVFIFCFPQEDLQGDIHEGDEEEAVSIGIKKQKGVVGTMLDFMLGKDE